MQECPHLTSNSHILRVLMVLAYPKFWSLRWTRVVQEMDTLDGKLKNVNISGF